MRKRGPRGRNFTPDERAIMLKIAIAGGIVSEVNQELEKHQAAEGLTPRTISEGSFSMLKGAYLSHIGNDSAFKEYIFHPSPMGKLKIKAAMQNK